MIVVLYKCHFAIVIRFKKTNFVLTDIPGILIRGIDIIILIWKFLNDSINPFMMCSP